MDTRPDRNEYFMGIAFAVRKRANCRGQRVGAVLVRDDRVISTGYNGTPQDMPNCDEDGCYRCANREQFISGTAYDVCICVHAEQNALLAAARFGLDTQDTMMYTTTRPCFGCTKELLQARVRAVWYVNDWEHPDEQVREQYARLQGRIPEGIKRVWIEDPDEEWARGRAIPDDTGHTIPGNEGEPMDV